jgi:hypothetical protein
MRSPRGSGLCYDDAVVNEGEYRVTNLSFAAPQTCLKRW